MAGSILIYCAMMILGVIVGYSLSFRQYGNKVLDVLDDLLFLNKITDEEYKRLKNKYIFKKDNLKNIKSLLKSSKTLLQRKERKQEELINEEENVY